MKKILKTCISIFLSLPLIYLTFINYKLYHSPSFKTENNITYNSEQYKHLHFLKQKIRKGAAEEMQQIYPEGFVFMNAIYGLAWAEFAEHINNKESTLQQEALVEIDYALQEILSPEGYAIFPREQRINRGAYFTGWSNYLRGKKLLLQVKPDVTTTQRFQQTCEEIATVITSGKSPYVESYPNQVWPADITTAVASLAIHDRIFKPRYKDTIQIWINRVKSTLDHKGLIPHAEWADTNYVDSRGSSMSLMLCFLKEIDAEFSEELFQKYKNEFLTYRFGLPGIREHHQEKDLGADVDSGPVILSVGGSASIVGQKAMALHGEKNIAKGLRNSIEGFGIGWEGSKNKNYLLGKLPIADAFIAWVNATEIESINQKETRWRWKFQLISLFIYFIFIGSIYWMWRE